MVKRLRHHPFTVVSGVRFPLGLPILISALVLRFFHFMKKLTKQTKNAKIFKQKGVFKMDWYTAKEMAKISSVLYGNGLLNIVNSKQLSPHIPDHYKHKGFINLMLLTNIIISKKP